MHTREQEKLAGNHPSRVVPTTKRLAVLTIRRTLAPSISLGHTVYSVSDDDWFVLKLINGTPLCHTTGRRHQTISIGVTAVNLLLVTGRGRIVFQTNTVADP
ncbi:hypothetical protein LSAT2_007800 [Lamellibrachia satsuma]|nr:hypothetical protein LSAT2_007800 [Lamellibrachia satsuma]